MNPNRRAKLQRIYNILDGKTQATATATQQYRQSVLDAENKLKQAISASNLDEVNKRIKEVQKSVDLSPLLDGLEVLQSTFETQHEEAQTEITAKLEELKVLSEKGDEDLSAELQARAETLAADISSLQSEFKKGLKPLSVLTSGIADITEQLKKFASKKTLTELRNDFESYKQQDDSDDKTMVVELEKKIQEVKLKLLSEISGKGGSMNRKVTFNGTDYLTKYTDINYIAGTNVTFTIANNNQTKMVDVTIDASGSGPGGGIVRSVNSVSTNTAAGASSATDYVYLCTGTMTLTLPTAVGNTNLYTIKNIGSGIVTVATTSTQTIDGQSTIIMPVQFTSIDVISDTANWNLT